MKARELMLEDWVLYGKRYAIVKRIEYSRCDILVNINPRHDDIVVETYDNIDAIPLTREMLDNNEMIHNVKRQSGDVFELSIEGELAYIQVKCRYVHEVQHALRICGFIDGANNFKVS